MRGPAMAAVLLALVGCADDRSADGGGGIETNNTVHVRILDSLGKGVGAAILRVRPSDWTGDPSARPAPGQILTTDSSGRAVVSLARGVWTFEAKRGGAAALATQAIDGSVALGGLVLAPSAKLSGRVALSAGEGFAWVAIAGTDHRVRTDSTGRWAMDSLPAGSLGVVVSNREGVVDTVDLAPGTRDSLPWSGSPSLRALDSVGWILLDDFSKERPSVVAAASGAVWYMASDREGGIGSRFLRRDGGNDSVWSRFLVPGEPPHRGSFQATFDFDSAGLAFGSAYMQVGMSFPVAGECLDLGGLDSVSVTLRSTAGVRLEFRSDIHDSLRDYSSYPGADIASTRGGLEHDPDTRKPFPTPFRGDASRHPMDARGWLRHGAAPGRLGGPRTGIGRSAHPRSLAGSVPEGAPEVGRRARSASREEAETEVSWCARRSQERS